MKNEPKDSKSHTQAPQWQQCVIIFWKEEGGRVISERSCAFFVSACIQQRFSVSRTLPKDVESMDEIWTQGFKKSYAGATVAAVCYNTLKRRGGRGISERGRASILSACIQQRSNVSGALAKDVESMVYRIKGHSSSAVVYHTKARQEDSLTNLQLGTV